jgi:hypothetical protein
MCRAAQLVFEEALRLPELEPLLELETPSVYFAVPGMYGGFSYTSSRPTAPMPAWSPRAGAASLAALASATSLRRTASSWWPRASSEWPEVPSGVIDDLAVVTAIDRPAWSRRLRLSCRSRSPGGPCLLRGCRLPFPAKRRDAASDPRSYWPAMLEDPEQGDLLSDNVGPHPPSERCPLWRPVLSEACGRGAS